jgi:myo-inositol-1(or 4)-monophosphatase
VSNLLDSDYGTFAVELAHETGSLIQKHWQRGALNVERKRDRTVVTETDQEVERLMRQRIKDRFPEHGIIGEEYGNENESAEWVWILDPIDGTLSYIHQIPLFGSLYGLLHNGQPVLGVIHQPILGQLCIGDGQRTLFNGEPCQVSGKTDVESATVLCTDPRRAAIHHNGPAWERFVSGAELLRSWGDCYGYMMVATGRADLMCDPILSPWDLLPLIPIIRGAGGTITDWNGNDPVQGKSALAGTPLLHAKAVAAL